MAELLTCSMNCQNKPIYVCECSDPKIFLCNDHAALHAESASSGKHLFTRIIKNPEPQTKIMIAKFLNNLKMQVIQDRLKIIQETSLLVKQTMEACAKSLKKLSDIEKKLDEYLHLCDTLEEIKNLNNNNFIESLLALSDEDAAKLNYWEDIIKINNKNIKEKIENLFAVQETARIFDINNFISLKPKIIKYIKDWKLFTVDVKSLCITSENVDESIISSGSTCLLEDGSVFCCFNRKTFIITPNNKLVHFNTFRYISNAGLIAVNDFIYLFGGCGNASLKFSLKSKNSTQLEQYPVPVNRDTSCACLNNEILIGGYDSPDIYAYNICSNSFSNVPITLNSGNGKILLATKRKAYIIENKKKYYESCLNDISSWNLIGDVNLNISSYDSYSLLYEDKFYFKADRMLIRFSLKNKELKHLKTF